MPRTNPKDYQIPSNKIYLRLVCQQTFAAYLIVMVCETDVNMDAPKKSVARVTTATLSYDCAARIRGVTFFV
jgi:hypothetical protein